MTTWYLAVRLYATKIHTLWDTHLVQLDLYCYQEARNLEQFYDSDLNVTKYFSKVTKSVICQGRNIEVPFFPQTHKYFFIRPIWLQRLFICFRNQWFSGTSKVVENICTVSKFSGLLHPLELIFKFYCLFLRHGFICPLPTLLTFLLSIHGW